MFLEFKHIEDSEMFSGLHISLIMVFADFANYAWEKHKWRVQVTDTISTPAEDASLGRVSKSHQRKIALDIRTKDVDIWILQDCIDYIHNKPELDKYKYLSFSGERRFAYIHNSGAGEHMHFAINSKYGEIKPPESL
jgi:hypothetical protein